MHTKAKIQTELLREKRYDAITVQDLLDKAATLTSTNLSMWLSLCIFTADETSRISNDHSL